MNKTNSNLAFLDSIKELLTNLPNSWVELTTHRLDVYNESAAKFEFLDKLKRLILNGQYSAENLEQLPTAYDYIRLGHQLSSLLEWVIAEINQLPDEQVIAFASQTMPILAILRKNALANQASYIYYTGENSPLIDESRLQEIYAYDFKQIQIDDVSEIPQHSDGTVIFVTQSDLNYPLKTTENVDISINLHDVCGAVALVHNVKIEAIVADVQHVRRRETIAMTPPHCLQVLNEMVNDCSITAANKEATLESQQIVEDCIKLNTGSQLTPLIASSGLSVQYAMMMGLVENALKQYPNKPIKILLPPNCYGGTNDQSRRIADLIDNVEIVDLLVDGDQDLVSSLEVALDSVAQVDAVALILAEIPTNPRVEVPDLQALANVLTIKRLTINQDVAIEPFFMVDQTFCPNVKLLTDDSELSAVKIISFASGSKFPSGGRCIAGYCAANQVAKDLMPLIQKHLSLSDNQANAHQLSTLAENMPSMPQRIIQAFEKTRALVNYIQKLLPESKMYYVTDEIAKSGFMPSVFSLDLPTRGETVEQRNDYQKQLNKRLIDFMIKTHPKQCKNCVSYGQLNGAYWTIPATSTQGTTKEADKDYVVRAALAPTVDVEQLCQSFHQFCIAERLL